MGDKWALVRDYWHDRLVDLPDNLLMFAPLWALIAAYLLIAALVFAVAESTTFLHALYATWLMLVGLADPNPEPTSYLGKALVGADALAGLIMFGMVLWMVTKTLEIKAPKSG